MKQPSLKSQLRDQRGVAMLFELVLVAAVLGLVGFAVYQSSQPHKTAATPTTKAPASAANLAASAAAVAEADVAADAAMAAEADAAAAELSDADTDAASLGDTANASF